MEEKKMAEEGMRIAVPSNLGPGGRAMLAGYAAALAAAWAKGFTRRGAERAYMAAAKADDLRAVLTSAPIHYEQMRETSSDSMDPRPFPVERLVEVQVDTPALGADARSVATGFIELMATHAGRGVEREASGHRYAGDGFWTTLFGPDSDALLPTQGAKAADLATEWGDSYADRRVGYVEAGPLAQELGMVRLANMLAMIPRVAQALWPELSEAVERATLMPERMREEAAVKVPRGPTRRSPDPVEKAFDDQWQAHVDDAVRDRSTDATPAAMMKAAADGILRYEIERNDPEADARLSQAWKEWEDEGLYGTWTTAESTLRWNSEAGPSPIMAEAVKAIGDGKEPADLERKLMRAMDGSGPNVRGVPGCANLVERHRIARRWAWFNPEYRSRRNDLVGREEELLELPDGSIGEVWMRLATEGAVEPEILQYGEFASWRLSIVAVRPDGSHRSDPDAVVATATGRLLWSYDDEAAFEMCDMVDGDAVDFHKAIRNKLYPLLGVTDAEDWSDATGGENSFLLISDAWIRPDMRGRGLLPILIEAARNVGFAAWYRVDAAGDHVHDLDDTDDYIDGEDGNTATYAKGIVFPIAGTPRDFGDTSHAPIMRNVSTGPRKTHVDQRIEARRDKLERVMMAAAESPLTVTYDPYEYPVT
jgi:hypothetical protein